MSKRKDEIHKAVKDKFGTNKLSDEKFSDKTYWDGLFESAEGEEKLEPIEANPDALPEESGLSYVEHDDDTALKVEVIKEAWALLSEQQQKTMYWCGVRSKSLAEAAKILGLSKDTVRTQFDRAKTKIKKLYVTRKAQISPIE